MSIKLLMKCVRPFVPKPDLSKPVLVTVGFSHFCEKARWALDMSPMRSSYIEDIHCPAMHFITTVNLSGLPRVSCWEADSTFSTLINSRHDEVTARRKDTSAIPKLLLPAAHLQKHLQIKLVNSNIRKQVDIDSAFKSTVVLDGGSSGIVKLLHSLYPSEMCHMYPDGEVGELAMELEHMLDTEFAPAVTAWCFGNMMLTGKAISPTSGTAETNTKMVKAFVEFATKGDIPLIEKLLFRTFGKNTIRPVMIKANNVGAAEAVQAVRDIHRIFRRMDALLELNNSAVATTSTAPSDAAEASIDHSNEKSAESNGTSNANAEDRFLLGTSQPTAADIAFASFCGPLLFPPQLDSLFVSRAQMQELARDAESTPGAANLVNLSKDLLATYKSARYALDLYQKYRFVHYNELGMCHENDCQVQVVPKTRR
jgi:hypothetical protein